MEKKNVREFVEKLFMKYKILKIPQHLMKNVKNT